MTRLRGMIRCIINSVVEGAIKLAAFSGYAGETISSREYMQHYGFTSRPLAGAEAVAVREGNHIIVVASDDRRFRVAVESGEVCIYTDEGDKIHLLRGREILINCGGKVTVNAATSCTVSSPLINLGGDRAGLRRFVDQRFATLYGSHTHSGVQTGSGNTGVPVQSFVLNDNCTDITRGI